MNPYLLALTVACGALWMAAYLWRRRHLYRLAWQLPGLMGYPLIGSAHNFFDATSEQTTGQKAAKTRRHEQ